MKQLARALLYMGLSLFLIPLEGEAALKLRLQGPVTTITVQDGTPQDSNSTVGAVTFTGPIDNFVNVVAAVVSKPVVGNPNLAQLELSVVSTSGPTGGTLIISGTDTDFFSGASGATTVQSVVGGTTNGATSVQGFLDRSNAEFGTSGAGICTPGVQGPFSGAFSSDVTNGCTLTGTAVSVTFVATTSPK